MKTGKNNLSFGSKLGAILAAAGSAVGLGNIWRFPTEAGSNGGAAFIILYVMFMLLLGVPVMISELAVGRYGQKNVSHSFYTMSGNKKGGVLRQPLYCIYLFIIRYLAPIGILIYNIL